MSKKKIKSNNSEASRRVRRYAQKKKNPKTTKRIRSVGNSFLLFVFFIQEKWREFWTIASASSLNGCIANEPSCSSDVSRTNWKFYGWHSWNSLAATDAEKFEHNSTIARGVATMVSWKDQPSLHSWTNEKESVFHPLHQNAAHMCALSCCYR